MSKLTKEQLLKIMDNESIKNDYKLQDYKTFFETGTYEGETLLELESCFEKLISIEISEKLFYKNIFNTEINANKIFLKLGDSSKLIKKILENNNDNILYWLDGHYSKGNNTGRGDKDVPLLEELKYIQTRYKKDIIIIDDYRLFGTYQNEDWAEITLQNILNIFLKEQIFTYFILEDRLCIFLKEFNND